MPIPLVKHGSKWSKERERNKDGAWRKKRSDSNMRKVKKTRDNVLQTQEKEQQTQMCDSEKLQPQTIAIVVECDVSACENNTGFGFAFGDSEYLTHCKGVKLDSQGKELKSPTLHLVVSYGRSTNYSHVFMCQDMEPSDAECCS